MIASNTGGARKKPQTVTIETPDHFELEFRVAGIGSRFLAYFTDKMVQLGMILTLALLAGLFLLVSEDLRTEWNLTAKLRGPMLQWVLAAVAILYGLVTIGYFMLFEYFWSGTTPGKRWQNIRVIRRDGRPLSFLDCAIRNILRFVDMLADFYPVGLIVMFLDPLNRRLGDMAANTLVVVHRDAAAPVLQRVPSGNYAADSALRHAAAGMTADDYQLVTRFLSRREGMDDKPRWDLGIEICERVLKTSVQPGRGCADAEDVLEKLELFYRERTRIL